MRRPGLLFPVLAGARWLLLFFPLDSLNARKGERQWIPAGSEWRVKVSVLPSSSRPPAWAVLWS